ncbi:MAG: Lrp/AsnC family transcriptional regulator [Chloroflexi bacterium]|nr:Lrp/AsnC family transcriptional regulator [Chloroflexota bacterium]
MDDLDRKILLALQTNARKKNAELARELEIAPSTVLERIRRLEENGLILGYRGVIDPAQLGFNIQAVVSVSLDRHEVDIIREFEQGIQQISHVRSCYHLTGRFDYLLHVTARDQEQLGDLIKNWIASIPGIGRVETSLVLSEVKPDEGLPIGQDLSIKNLTSMEDNNG